MNAVNILILSHEEIGTSLLNVANRIFGSLPSEHIFNLTVAPNNPTDEIMEKIQTILQSFPENTPFLFLTDLFGATPFNIAKRFVDRNNLRLLTGLNLPMLLRVINYRHLSLDELCEKAIDGGQVGIQLYEPNGV